MGKDLLDFLETEARNSGKEHLLSNDVVIPTRGGCPYSNPDVLILPSTQESVLVTQAGAQQSGLYHVTLSLRHS